MMDKKVDFEKVDFEKIGIVELTYAIRNNLLDQHGGQMRLIHAKKVADLIKQIVRK